MKLSINQFNDDAPVEQEQEFLVGIEFFSSPPFSLLHVS